MSVPPPKVRSADCPPRGAIFLSRGSAPGGEHEFSVGKGEHYTITNHDREVPDRGWRCRQKTVSDSPHGGGVLAAALEPWLEVVGLAHHLRLLNSKAGLFAKRNPFALGIDPAMGWVSQRFDLVLECCTLRIVGGERVDEDEATAGPQDPSDFAHRQRHIVEMMGGQPGRDDVEVGIR